MAIYLHLFINHSMLTTQTQVVIVVNITTATTLSSFITTNYITLDTREFIVAMCFVVRIG